MSSTKPDKVCRVCGDKALAKNYCATSCESCKAFFRRNATKLEKFKCFSDDNCQVNMETRKRCRRCRLKKCYDVGMKKEWILTERERQERMKIRDENRRLRLEGNRTPEDLPRLESSTSNSIQTDAPVGDDNDSNCVELIHQVINLDSDNNFDDTPNELLDEINTTTAEESYSSSFNETQTADEVAVECSGEVVAISRPITDYNNQFNEKESNRLTELLSATKHLVIDLPHITSQITTLPEALDFVSVKWDQEIPNIVKTAKTLVSFKNMCEDDQIILLKYGAVEVNLMRSIACYEKQGEFWYIHLNNNRITRLLGLDMLKQLSNENYQSYRSFMNKLADEWDLDHMILHLLLAIILYEPNRPGLIYKDVIRLQQQIYINLLKRYLQLRYRSESEAITRLIRFMRIVKSLHNLHECHIRSYLQQTPAIALSLLSKSPLLQEIFDK